MGSTLPSEGADFKGSNVDQISPFTLPPERGNRGSPVIPGSEGGTDDISSTPPPSVTATNAAIPGQNSGHHHNTRFWMHQMAAYSLLDTPFFVFTPAHQAVVFVAE
jgi:hypothetical protein